MEDIERTSDNWKNASIYEQRKAMDFIINKLIEDKVIEEIPVKEGEERKFKVIKDDML